MSEHSLDLVAIKKKLGTHSIFGPSSAAMWALCSGSLIPNLLADDDANEDAAYGTVGHEVGETWLKRVLEAVAGDIELARDALDEYRPTELVGVRREVVEGSGRSFSILIDDEMLQYVREYVEWCLAEDGDHYVEERVDISAITPIPDQSGTADHSACTRRRLTITDLKMGRGIRVDAEWNYQGLLYALGFFWRWDWAYNFETIAIRIAQPRLDHWDTWEISRAELLRFAEWIKGRAALAWQPGAARTAGYKQCQWCKVQGDCAANASFFSDLADDGFDVVQDEPEPEQITAMNDSGIVVGPDGVIHGVEYTVKEAQMLTVALERGVTPGKTPDPYKLSTAALAKLLLNRKRVEKFFEAAYAELLARADAGEDVPGFKLATGRAGRREYDDEAEAAEYYEKWGVDPEKMWVRKLVSPAQAEPLLREAGFTLAFAKELIDSLVHRPAGRDTLVPLKDEREALSPPGDSFDDLDEVDGL